MTAFENNAALTLSATVEKGKYACEIAAGTLYRFRLNGEVIAYGPARAPHGYARIDRFEFNAQKPENEIVIEVVHYDTASYYMPHISGFVHIVIRDSRKETVLTEDDFKVSNSGHRNFETEKFTVQRHIREVYDFSRTFTYSMKPSECQAPVFLERGAPMPELSTFFPSVFTSGKFDFGRVVTGFVRCHLKAGKEGCSIIIGFDEADLGGFPGRRAWWGKYEIVIDLPPFRELDFESFEVYSMRYAAVEIKKGSADVSKMSIREYAFPKKEITLPAGTSDNPLMQAALETFRQNTMDTFMDCPGRERAAWLCDSFFTARASFLFTGNTHMEETFLENFLIPTSFPGVPDGMFPMCYPADTTNFIPQWAMWLVLQIDDYLNSRGGAQDFPHKYEDRFRKFIRFFDPYVNSSGLLCNLPGWNFIDWSKAKDFTGGIHYPTNLLFSRVLEIMSHWYDDQVMAQRAEAIRAEVFRTGMNNGRLWDNDSRQCSSEIAQYFAILFGGSRFSVIDFDSASQCDAPCGLFIGRFLRFEILLKKKRIEQLRDELKSTFSPMVEMTGTFWEKLEPDSSCCHGFTSSVANLLAESNPSVQKGKI